MVNDNDDDRFRSMGILGAKKGLIGHIKLKSCLSQCTERQGWRVVSGGALFKDVAHD